MYKRLLKFGFTFKFLNCELLFFICRWNEELVFVPFDDIFNSREINYFLVALSCVLAD